MFTHAVLVPHRVVPIAQQPPPAHDCVLVQRVLHAPHEVGTISDASQPVAALASQSPRPGWQTVPQVRAVVHTGVVNGAPVATQRVAQAPQLVVVVRLVSQPSVATLLQLPNPDTHANPQILAVQLGVALVAAGHRVEHAPQLFGSMRVSTHEVPQRD